MSCIFLWISFSPAGGWWGWYWGTLPQHPDGRWGGIQFCLEPPSRKSAFFLSHRKPVKTSEKFYNFKLGMLGGQKKKIKSQHTSLKLVTCSKGIFSSSSMAWRIVLSTLCRRKSKAAGFCQHTRATSGLKSYKKWWSKEHTVSWTEMYHFETAGDVTAEHSGLQRLHMASHIGLRVHDMAVVR